jgi:hypothetical protein
LAIYLNSKPQLRAKEINNIGKNGFLAVKIIVHQGLTFQMIPENSFRIGKAFAQFGCNGH